jgi:hypothetical protein
MPLLRLSHPNCNVDLSDGVYTLFPTTQKNLAIDTSLIPFYQQFLGRSVTTVRVLRSHWVDELVR